MRQLLFIIALVLTGNISIAQDLTDDFSYFPKTEFNAEVGTIFEKIVIDGFDFKVPCYFIQPKSKPDNRYVILLHGQKGNL